MRQMVMDTSALQLPQVFVDIIGAEKVLIREVGEGILLTPALKTPKPLRGLIKDTGLTMEYFLRQKHADKELEL